MKLTTSKRKKFRVGNKVKKVAKPERFRLSISRSSKNISAQIIDDKNNKTLVSASSIEKDQNNKIKKIDLSNKIAELLARRAIEKKITKVFFDRGRYKYHGRIKIFADNVRLYPFGERGHPTMYDWAEIDSQSIQNLIDNETVTGGMIPKINNCLDVASNGVKGVCIIDGRLDHSILFELLSNAGSGTLIRE